MRVECPKPEALKAELVKAYGDARVETD
jgi:hypothetical protein